MAAHTDGATVRYRINTPDQSQWAVIEGVWNAGASTLSADTVFASSNNNDPVSFSSGPKAIVTGMASAWLADFSSTASGKGAALIKTKQSSTGSVDRTQQEKNSDVISVRDHISTAVDGTTSNQTGIAAAVAAAYAAGTSIDWPPGTYISTATIPNFHDVLHTGSGVFKRGSDTFKISGKTGANNLYVDPAGSNNNDGLTASYPLQTIQAAFDRLSNWTDALNRNGTFQINLAAGTYTDGCFVTGLQSRNLINVVGPSVGGHPNVPTAIINGSSATSQAGIFVQNKMKLYVKDVKVINFTLSATGYGVVADADCYLQTDNVHTNNNQYAGICVDDGSIGRIQGGIHNANVFYGFRAHDNSLFTFGYHGDATNNRPQLTNNPVGVGILTGSQGHVDYCDITGGTAGIKLEDGSRVHVMGTTSSGCSVADIYTDPTCSWYNDPTTTNTFGSTVKYADTSRSVTTAQFDKTSSASYSAVPGLSVNLVAGTTYRVRGVLSVTAGASGGVAAALGGTASATLRVTGKVYNGTTLANSQAATTMSGAIGSYTGVATEIYIDGTVICTASGTLTVRFAQNASNGTASSVLHPSYFIVERLIGAAS
ncbi:MAG: right-handed parallel beta-helix repeat-containing protein [Methylobacter sp.]